MRGLMQDYPLTIDAIFRHVEQHYGDATIVTNGPDGATRSTYAEWADRTRRLGGVLEALGIPAPGPAASWTPSASPPAAGWGRSAGTASGTSSCTSPRRRRAACCTRSTSGC